MGARDALWRAISYFPCAFGSVPCGSFHVPDTTFHVSRSMFPWEISELGGLK